MNKTNQAEEAMLTKAREIWGIETDVVEDGHWKSSSERERTFAALQEIAAKAGIDELDKTADLEDALRTVFVAVMPQTKGRTSRRLRPKDPDINLPDGCEWVPCASYDEDEGVWELYWLILITAENLTPRTTRPTTSQNA